MPRVEAARRRKASCGGRPAARSKLALSIDALIAFLVRNWAMVAMLSTVATMLILPALVLAKYTRISLNILRTTKPPLSRSPLDFVRLSGEPVVFSAYDGQRLAGMIIRAPEHQPRRGMIVFAHEYCSDLHSCARYCRPLNEAGYDIFAFDFRGHGQSECEPHYVPRQWVTDREVNDIRGALAFIAEWLESRGLPAELGVVGISRGGGAAILAAGEEPRIRAIVVDGLFSTDLTIEYFMKRWAYIFAKVRVFENHHNFFWRFLRWVVIQAAQREFGCTFPSVRKAIERMTPRPLMFIHGQKDSYLPVELGRALYNLAPQPKLMWLAPGARHNQAVILHPDRYAELTTRFFHAHLARMADGQPAHGPATVPVPLGASPVHAFSTAVTQPDARIA